MYLPLNITAGTNISYNCVQIFSLTCVRLQNSSFKSEQNIINNSNKWKQDGRKACWLHIQQPRWDVMMPVSQLVVLVSYNFWVQLVGSDLGHWRRFKDRREAEWTGRFRLQRRRAADEAAENENVSTGHLWATCSFLFQKSPAARVLLATIPPHYPVCSEWHTDWLDVWNTGQAVFSED